MCYNVQSFSNVLEHMLRVRIILSNTIHVNLPRLVFNVEYFMFSQVNFMARISARSSAVSSGSSTKLLRPSKFAEDEEEGVMKLQVTRQTTPNYAQMLKEC
jgi:hypothetical protein